MIGFVKNEELKKKHKISRFERIKASFGFVNIEMSIIHPSQIHSWIYKSNFKKINRGWDIKLDL